MIGKARQLGLALVACLALGALAASGAQAHEFKSSSGKGRTAITGASEGNQVLSWPKAELLCKGATFEGTVEGNEVTSTTITPTYGKTVGGGKSECSDPLTETEAIVHTNHCAYSYGSTTDGSGDAPFAIECAAGSVMNITFPGIDTEWEVAAQSPKGGVHYTNLVNHGAGGKEAITVNSTVKNVKVTCKPLSEAGELFCFLMFGESTVTTEATLSGNAIFTGYEDTAAAPLTGTAKTTPTGTTTHGNTQVNTTTIGS